MIAYFLASIVAFLGLIVGLVIGYYTPEEFKDGKKYFILLQRLLVLVILFFVMFLNGFQIFWIIVALFAVSTAIYQIDLKLPIYYAFLGVLFFLGSKSQNMFLITSGLTFLFGLPSGTLIEKKKLKTVLMCLIFLVAAWLLFFVGII